MDQVRRHHSIALCSRAALIAAPLSLVSALLFGGCAAPSAPDEEEVGSAEQALTTCVTIQRGTLGTVEDATIANGVTFPGWGPATLRTGTQMASLLKFDLSAIPSGAVVTSATLSLTTNAAVAGSPLWARRVTAPWSEATVTFLSFNQQVAGTTSGSMTAATANALHTMSLAPALVQDWLDGATPNHGLFLETRISSPSTWKENGFLSSESPTVAQRPSLQVCYLEVDHCAPAPCQNGGTCTSDASGYTCSCPAGYSGANCEIAPPAACPGTTTSVAGACSNWFGNNVDHAPIAATGLWTFPGNIPWANANPGVDCTNATTSDLGFFKYCGVYYQQSYYVACVTDCVNDQCCANFSPP